MSFVPSFYEVSGAVQLTIGGPGYVGIFDPSSRLNGGTAAVTQAADGITWPITGGVTGDITDMAYAVWKLQSARGVVSVPALLQGGLFGEYHLRTGPGDSSDTTSNIILANESTLESATVDGMYVGVRFSAATRNVRQGGIVNGVASGATEGGGTGPVAQLAFGFPWQYTTTLGRTFFGWHAIGRTAARAYASTLAQSAGNTSTSTDTLYIIRAVGKSAATAGNVTIKDDVWVYLPEGVALGS